MLFLLNKEYESQVCKLWIGEANSFKILTFLFAPDICPLLDCRKRDSVKYLLLHIIFSLSGWLQILTDPFLLDQKSFFKTDVLIQALLSFQPLLKNGGVFFLSKWGGEGKKAKGRGDLITEVRQALPQLLWENQTLSRTALQRGQSSPSSCPLPGHSPSSGLRLKAINLFYFRLHASAFVFMSVLSAGHKPCKPGTLSLYPCAYLVLSEQVWGEDKPTCEWLNANHDCCLGSQQ